MGGEGVSRFAAPTRVIHCRCCASVAVGQPCLPASRWSCHTDRGTAAALNVTTTGDGDGAISIDPHCAGFERDCGLRRLASGASLANERIVQKQSCSSPGSRSGASGSKTAASLLTLFALVVSSQPLQSLISCLGIFELRMPKYRTESFRCVGIWRAMAP